LLFNHEEKTLKRLIAIVTVLAPLTVNAQPTLQQCNLIAQALNVAASARDAQMSPEHAFTWIKGMAGTKLNDATIKKAVNAAYFDPRYALANTSEFVDEFTNACANPGPQWQPLK
jgi:hypothetical protein